MTPQPPGSDQGSTVSGIEAECHGARRALVPLSGDSPDHADRIDLGPDSHAPGQRLRVTDMPAARAEP